MPYISTKVNIFSIYKQLFCQKNEKSPSEFLKGTNALTLFYLKNLYWKISR